MKKLLLPIVLALLWVRLAAKPYADKYDEAMKHYRAGQQFLNSEHWDAAEGEFKQAIKLYPLLDIAHYGLGQVDMATERYREAVVAYQQCREAFKSSAAESIVARTAAEHRLAGPILDIKTEISSLASGRLKPAGRSQMPGHTH